MNIQEYKNNRIKEIDIFLREINFNTLFRTVLENINEYSHGDEELTKKFFHFTLKNAVLGLNELYTDLKDTNLSIGIASKEDVDKEIDEYVKKVMIFLEEFVDYIVSEYYEHIENVSKSQSSNINTSLKFFKFKIGDKIYDWYDINVNNQYNNTSNECVTDNLKMVLEYIRDLPKQIRSKLSKLEELQEIGKYFDEQSKEWKAFMNLYFNIRRSTDPKQIDEMFEEAKKLIPIKHR